MSLTKTRTVIQWFILMQIRVDKVSETSGSGLGLVSGMRHAYSFVTLNFRSSFSSQNHKKGSDRGQMYSSIRRYDHL